MVLVERRQALHGLGIHLFYRLNLVAPEGDAKQVVAVGQGHVDGVALHAELSSAKAHVVPHVEAI